MAHYNFKKDIEIGEDGEQVIINDLISLGASYNSSNKTNSHDIVVIHEDKEVSYECKTDIFDDTGNMFIETHCREKESGILVTKADWFVTYFKKLNEIWYIKTQDLKNILKNHEHNLVTKCGDANSDTKGYLINKNMFRDDFIIRDPIKRKTIIKKWQKKYKKKSPSK